MIFEKWWKNCCLVVGLWAVDRVLEMYLSSLNPSKWLYNGPPPDILTSLPWFMIGGIAAYLSLYLYQFTSISIGPKLIKNGKNLSAYGIKSASTFVIILGEIVSILATVRNFENTVFHIGNSLTTFQEFMVSGGFTIFGIFLIWNLRNIKIEYEEPQWSRKDEGTDYSKM